MASKLRGIKLKSGKATEGMASVKMPAPKTVTIPMSMHIGKPVTPIVKVGSEVKVGTLIAEDTNNLSAPIYSSVSGKVTKLADVTISNGNVVQMVVIESDGEMTIDENIKMTKEVVEYAHAHGASVEAEVGTVGGNEDGVIGGIKYADCGECVKLVKEAGVDALAPALGSVHGPYQGEPVLGFVEMEAIKEATNMPLVLHGGTGIPDEKIQKAIACGTCKINVNTECQLAFNKLLREFLADEKNAKVYDPRKLLGPAAKGIASAVTEKMTVFGSMNK